jgi:DNA-binding response OmpR family regulator
MKPRHKLLIVDDDPTSRDWLERFAADLGYEALAVSSGEEALALCTGFEPDLITLDLLLPGMDGVETLRALRQLAPRVPVIMLSGAAATHAIVHAVKHGATDFLRKPFEPNELETAPPHRAPPPHPPAGPQAPARGRSRAFARPPVPRARQRR